MKLYDINVHPSKLEVRFLNEWQVFHAIKSSITNILQDILKVIPNYTPYNSNSINIINYQLRAMNYYQSC